MIVCQVTTAHYWFDPRIFQKQCKSVALSGQTVYFIAPNAPDKTIDNVIVKGINWKRGNRFQRFFNVNRKAFKMVLALRPDIVHFHDPDFLPFALLLKKKGFKIVYDIHESYPEVFYYKRWIPKLFRGPISNFYRWYELYVSSRIDAVVPATEHIEERFKIRGINSMVVRNFPKISDFEGNSQLLNSKIIRLCYAGTICKETCIKELVDSLHEIQNIELILIGWKPEQQYFEELKQSKGWSKVIWKQGLERGEVLDWISSSNIGVAFYKKHLGLGLALSTKLHEYMAAKIPCITCDFGEMKKLIDEVRCGITVDSSNPKKIKEGILRLIEDENGRILMGENGRKAIESTFSWEKESKKLIELYANI